MWLKPIPECIRHHLGRRDFGGHPGDIDVEIAVVDVGEDVVVNERSEDFEVNHEASFGADPASDCYLDRVVMAVA